MKKVFVKYLIIGFSIMLLLLCSFHALGATSAQLNQNVSWPWEKYMSVSFAGDQGSGYKGNATCTLSLDANGCYCFSISVTGSSRNAAAAILTLTNNSSYELEVTYGDSTTQTISSGGTIQRRVEAVKSSTSTDTLVIKNVKPIINETFTVTTNEIVGNGNITSFGSEEINVSNALKQGGSVVVTTNSAAELAYSVDASDGYAFFGFLTSSDNFIAVNAFWKSTSSADFSGSVIIESNMTLTPIFVPYGATAENKTAIFRVKDVFYPYLDMAISKAQTDGSNVVACSSGIARHSKYDYDDDGSSSKFTIPSNVTVLLPYQLDAETLDASTDAFPYANYTLTTSTTSQLDPSKAWLTVRIAAETYIVNNGKIVVGGTLSGRSGAYAGATVGTATSGFACLILEGDYADDSGTHSQLKMGANSILSVCGYITGAGTIDATATNVRIYQPLVIVDYRGGSYVIGSAADSIENVKIGSGFFSFNIHTGIPIDNFPGREYIFPMTQYSLRNIQVSIKIGDNSIMYTYIVLHTTEMASGVIPAANNQSVVPFVGAKSSGGLYQLHENAMAVVEYDSEKFVSTENGKSNAKREMIGRTRLEFAGKVDFGSISMLVQVLNNEYSLSSSICSFYIPYNFSICIKDKGVFTVNERLALYPGAEFIVDEGATLIVASKFVAMDGLFEQSAATSGEQITIADTAYSTADGRYPTSADLLSAGFSQIADLIVNGTMSVKKLDGKDVRFAGIVQTMSNSAKLDLSSCTQEQLSASQQVGLVGSWKISVVIISVSRYFAGATLHELDAMAYNSATGELIELKAGNIYNGYYGELANDGTYKNTISYTKDSFVQKVYTTSSSPSSFTTRTLSYNAEVKGEWYLPGEAYAYVPEYRVEDYTWLNATIKLSDTTYFDANATTVGTTKVLTLTDDGSQIVKIGDVYYHVRKIVAKELSDEALTVKLNGQTINMSFNRVYASLDENDKDYQKDLALIDAMIAYGEAAKSWLDGVYEEVELLPKPDAENAMKGTVEASSAVDGLTLATKGANIYFRECLRLGVAFQLNGGTLTGNQITLNGKKYTIVQMGLLVDEPGGKDCGTLTTESYEKGYLLYDITGADITDTGANNKPNSFVVGGTEGVLNVMPEKDASGRWTVIFDLKSLQYVKRFEVRPFVVVRDAVGETHCIYGGQYLYGLEDYVARQYGSTSSSVTNEFKNLCYSVWEYAKDAHQAFAG